VLPPEGRARGLALSCNKVPFHDFQLSNCIRLSYLENLTCCRPVAEPLRRNTQEGALCYRDALRTASAKSTEGERKLPMLDPEPDQCSFAYSALACFRMGMSGSASFQRFRKT
jgi:hypothetical protein